MPQSICLLHSSNILVNSIYSSVSLCNISPKKQWCEIGGSVKGGESFIVKIGTCKSTYSVCV